MMNILESIIAYFCLKYPNNSELSNARLTKMVYLADWFSALNQECQLTNINWVFNHYGPYVDDVSQEASKSELISSRIEPNAFGTNKTIFEFIGDSSLVQLDENTRKILDFVIDKTKTMYFNDFIDYVYSTYPVRAKERYATFDLPRLALEYKKGASNN